MTPSRWGERGVVRGCCLGLLVLVVVAGAAGFVAVRALMRPDLGAGPSGTRHGGTPEAIAVEVASELAAALGRAPHATAALSERDLTVVARARNPDGVRFQDPEARVRNGEVVISAATSLGPLPTVTVARAIPRLEAGADGRPRLTAGVTSVELGSLAIPQWAWHTIDPRGGDLLALDPVLDSVPALAALRPSLDCVAVAPDGVRLGFHRPGTTVPGGACV